MLDPRGPRRSLLVMERSSAPSGRTTAGGSCLHDGTLNAHVGQSERYVHIGVRCFRRRRSLSHPPA
eukprot:3359912-Prorocentrum_lima.AAC.1